MSNLNDPEKIYLISKEIYLCDINIHGDIYIIITYLKYFYLTLLYYFKRKILSTIFSQK